MWPSLLPELTGRCVGHALIVRMYVPGTLVLHIPQYSWSVSLNAAVSGTQLGRPDSGLVLLTVCHPTL
jgi:hypothetical protein